MPISSPLLRSLPFSRLFRYYITHHLSAKNASEYMRSIESTGSNRFSIIMDRRIPPPPPSEPSPILTQMAPPEPR